MRGSRVAYKSNMAFATCLRAWMKYEGISTMDLAKMLDCHHTSVTNWLNGNYMPHSPNRFALEDLGFDPKNNTEDWEAMEKTVEQEEEVQPTTSSEKWICLTNRVNGATWEEAPDREWAEQWLRTMVEEGKGGRICRVTDIVVGRIRVEFERVEA